MRFTHYGDRRLQVVLGISTKIIKAEIIKIGMNQKNMFIQRFKEL